MDNWFVSALLALIFFGLWGFFPKLAVAHISPPSAVVYQVAGGLLVGFVALALVGFRPETRPMGVLFAVLTGVAGVLGTLFYYAAASRGRLAVVVGMTALYPFLTILLAYFLLREPISGRQLLGMLFALAAIVLFAV